MLLEAFPKRRFAHQRVSEADILFDLVVSNFASYGFGPKLEIVSLAVITRRTEQMMRVCRDKRKVVKVGSFVDER